MEIIKDFIKKYPSLKEEDWYCLNLDTDSIHIKIHVTSDSYVSCAIEDAKYAHLAKIIDDLDNTSGHEKINLFLDICRNIVNKIIIEYLEDIESVTFSACISKDFEKIQIYKIHVDNDPLQTLDAEYTRLLVDEYIIDNFSYSKVLYENETLDEILTKLENMQDELCDDDADDNRILLMLTPTKTRIRSGTLVESVFML